MKTLMFVACAACGAPRSPAERAAPPTSPIDAPPARPDASIDAPPPDAPPIACWEQGRTNEIVEVLRVHVRAGGSVDVRAGDKLWNVDVAEMDVVDVISGDMTRVLAPFRKQLYAAKPISFCDRKRGSCGEGFADPNISALIAAKGEDRIVVVALPPQGATGGVMVPRLRARYGEIQPILFRVCPIP